MRVGLYSKKLGPYRAASHSASSCSGSSLKGPSCLRMLMRSKSIQMPPSERFILNAASADTKDQLWGTPCFTQIEKETLQIETCLKEPASYPIFTFLCKRSYMGIIFF